MTHPPANDPLREPLHDGPADVAGAAGPADAAGAVNTPGVAEEASPRGSRGSFAAGIALLWSYAGPHLPKIALALLLGLIGTATLLATPLVTKWVLDSLESGARSCATRDAARRVPRCRYRG